MSKCVYFAIIIMNNNITLLALKDVIKETKYSRSTIKRKIKKGEFPAPLDLGGNCHRWTFISIENWIKSNTKEFTNA